MVCCHNKFGTGLNMIIYTKTSSIVSASECAKTKKPPCSLTCDNLANFI